MTEVLTQSRVSKEDIQRSKALQRYDDLMKVQSDDIYELTCRLDDLLTNYRLLHYDVILPFVFNFGQKPITLEDHYPIFAMFPTVLPKYSISMAGRQVGKSLSKAMDMLMAAWTISTFRQMYITPLSDQAKMFSAQYLKPLIENSNFRQLFVSKKTTQNVMQKFFANGSVISLSFTFNNVGRVRGRTNDRVNYDEIQGQDHDNIPIINETMSASPYEIANFSGTFLGTDNTANSYWLKSSQCEWFIPCRHCTTAPGSMTTWNIPHTDYHAFQMISDPTKRDDISAERPGIVCYKCGKPLHSQDGCWKARYEDRLKTFPGIRMPQTIMPFHNQDQQKWESLWNKYKGSAAYGTRKVMNEVLSEPYDVGLSLITLEELRMAGGVPFTNNQRHPDKDLIRYMKRFILTVMGIDWGGGGIDMNSLTSLAMTGMLPNGRTETVWGCKLFTPNDSLAEVAQIMKFLNFFQPKLIAHDYNGAGSVREDLLLQRGVDPMRIVPIVYGRTARQQMIVPVEGTDTKREYLYVDKARTLMWTVSAIRTGWHRFFKLDYEDNDNPGLIADFLNLVMASNNRLHGSDVFGIDRKSGHGDDFAQAVNLSNIGAWFTTGKFPALIDTSKLDFSDVSLSLDDDSPLRTAPEPMKP